MQHFQTVEGAQTAGDLLDDAAHRFQVRLWMVEHPLRQRLAVDVLADRVQVAALPRWRAGLDHVRVVEAPGNPFFQQKALQIGGVATQIERGRLQHHRGAAVFVDGQMHMAAAADMQLANDAVAIELQARLQQWRQRQFAELPLHVVDGLLRQAVDAHQLCGEVVVAAVSQCLPDNPSRGQVEVVAMLGNELRHIPRADVLVDAIGDEQEQIADRQRQGAVVDLQVPVDAQRAAQVAGFRRHAHAVIVGQLFEAAVAQSIDACIADVEQVRAGRLEHQRAEGADIATVAVIAVRAVAGLCMQPGIDRHQHPLRRLLHRPGVGGAEVVGKKARHRCFAGDMTDLTAADAVGQRDGDALAGELGTDGHAGAVKVLVGRLAPAVRILAEGNGELAGHLQSARKPRRDCGPGPSFTPGSVDGALGRGAHVGGVERQAGEGQAADQVA